MSLRINNPAVSNAAIGILIGIGIAILGLSVYLVLKGGEKSLNSLNEAKKGRTTGAIVKAKQYVRFDEQNHSYINNFGESVEAPPGTEQWRIYYQIDNFDQVPEPKRSELMRSEEARIKKFGFRFYPLSTLEKASYDKTQVGDRLEILYRYMGDEKEIINIRNLSRPDS